MLRYAKGKALPSKIGEWQSAILLGFLTEGTPPDGQEPEAKLCLTVDAFSGVVHCAPGDAKRRYNETKAACQTIAEWWPNVTPPPNAVL